MLRSDETCPHPSGHHPYHYSTIRRNGEDRYEDFRCGHCEALVRSVKTN